jgi:hypothetical protein
MVVAQEGKKCKPHALFATLALTEYTNRVPYAENCAH